MSAMMSSIERRIGLATVVCSASIVAMLSISELYFLSVDIVSGMC